MHLPFTKDAFLDVFAQYNQAIWPAQFLAYLLAAVTVALALRPTARAGKAICFLLAVFWGFTGVAYHWLHFAAINKAAYGFGALFLAQSVAFLVIALRHKDLSFALNSSGRGLAGAACVIYALAVYPLLNRVFGPGYPFSPSFGVAPCPMTIFTFGVLLWTANPLPRGLLIVPTLWALLGLSAATQLGIREDFGLTASALLAVVLLARRPRAAEEARALPQEVSSR